MALEIPAEFVDVDFTTQPKYVFGDLGLSSAFAARRFKEFEMEYADVVLTEAEIREAIEKTEAEKTGTEYLLKRIKNQGRLGSCVTQMATYGLEILQAQQFGLDNTDPLAGEAMYDNIGSSPSSGSMLADALDFAVKYGCPPEATPENITKFGADACSPVRVWQGTGDVDRWSEKRKTTAARFKLREYAIFRTWAGIQSATLRGWVVGVGRDGHSILYLRPTIRNGRKGMLYPNSWNYDWGFAAGTQPGGFGFDSEAVASRISWAMGFRDIVVNI